MTTMLTSTPVLPDLDPGLGEALADETLVALARSEKPQRVKALGSRWSSTQSGQSRAWTNNGDVD